MSEVIDPKELDSHIGKERVSDWFKVTQEQINKFADVTLDHQFIHLDKARAEPLFGDTIAHGFLLVSLIPHLSSQTAFTLKNTVMGINYGSNKLRFIHPVKSNTHIRCKSVLSSYTVKSENNYLLTNTLTFESKESKTNVLFCEALTLIVTH